MIRKIEWPTLLLLMLTYAVFGWSTDILAEQSLALAILIAGFAIAQHASLQHEVIHGHPTDNETVNTILVAPALALIIPYLRFRDTHLAHHRDSNLTDPYDDPETNFLDPARWEKSSAFVRAILTFNNTLAGRMVLGPFIGQLMFMCRELRDLKQNPKILTAWLWHIPAVGLVLIWVTYASMPFWAYAVAVYFALSLQKIRTFLEHQAHEKSRARTVIIEDRGPLALLFLNNNFHSVHHSHPGVAWYRLPQVYRAQMDRFLTMNEGYRFRSYGSVFRAYLFRQKDPVPHPLWRRRGS